MTQNREVCGGELKADVAGAMLTGEGKKPVIFSCTCKITYRGAAMPQSQILVCEI